MPHDTDQNAAAQTDGKDASWPISKLRIPLIASLTLGLAPFVPEPHLIGKLRWIAGGGDGMVLMDWADIAMHGAPWVWLFVTIGLIIRSKFRG